MAFGFASSASARVLPILVMGDSYSAGNGAGDYFGPKGCWRSPNDYAGVFARALQAAPYDQPTVLENVACSGDTTRAFAHSRDGRRPQLDAVNKSYDDIFLTVGGDDIDFSGIVKNCLIQITRDGRKCNALLSAAENDLRDGTLEGHLVDVLDGIRPRASSQARIVLLGYPYIEGQEHYLLPYGHGKSINVPKRLRALEDLGDQVQQRAIGRLNARYRTSNFVFVKTKALFAGHELDALSLNPSRWFVAPETDAGLAWHEWWYHPNPTGWYEEAQLLLRDPEVPRHPPSLPPGGAGVLSANGRVGPLVIDRSSRDQVISFAGQPDAEYIGSESGGPLYDALGYRCASSERTTEAPVGGRYCQTAFYIDVASGTLGQFFTTSRAYRDTHGTRVGMATAAASAREHRAFLVGCATGMYIRTHSATLVIEVIGGHDGKPNSHGIPVTGGHVELLAVDSNKHDPGVFDCV